MVAAPISTMPHASDARLANYTQIVHFPNGARSFQEGVAGHDCDLIKACAVRRDIARRAADTDGVLVPALSPLHVIAALHIQLLGSFRLTADHLPVPPLASPRLQVLLAYLVLHRAAPHVRAHLAFQLWPDTTEPQAHANLRTLLHRLRHALPDADHFLQIDGQAVQWRSDARCTVDVADFERALAEVQAAEQHGDQPTLRRALAHAVEAYRGELLPGWYDDWVLCERERLHQSFLMALERLILVLEHGQDYLAAIGYAQRLLRHDPLHEAAYQYLMRLHALRGDRASAVRVYQTCATVLARELAVAPSAATRDVYERLHHMRAQQSCISPYPHPAPLRSSD